MIVGEIYILGDRFVPHDIHPALIHFFHAFPQHDGYSGKGLIEAAF